jgi:uncharacterized membrane protein YtjA (UPF0391 family)
MPNWTMQFFLLALVSALFCVAPLLGMARLLTGVFLILFLVSAAAQTAESAEAI